MADQVPKQVKLAFEPETVRVAIADIQPLRPVTASMKKSPKYAQIASATHEVGLVEPPVVARDPARPGKYLLLEGHVRIDILKEAGETEVVCLVATDDEAFTYNKRVSRLATVQEHAMMLKAIEQGVSEERIAKVLNVNVSNIKTKRRLLDGICEEATDLLKDKQVPVNTFTEIKKMLPVRQIEAAQLMVAMNKYSVSYAKALVGATPKAQLAEWAQPKKLSGLSDDQVALMERESEQLDREFRLLEQSYGTDHLDLVITTGFLTKLMANARVVRFLVQRYPELLAEFQKMAGPHLVAA